MSKVNGRKQAYDAAQKVWERLERMAKEEGWSEVFIPQIKKKRDEAQEVINRKGTDQREADHNRGVLEMADMVLEFVDRRIKNAKANMAKNTDAKLEV